MAGLPTTAGWHFLCARAGGTDLMPGTDSPVVARMRAAGCVILGKTNVPVLSATGSHANDSWPGRPSTPWRRACCPAAPVPAPPTAVAASLAVLGLAEETGGSIQNPASAQGLVGIKPTFALVPNAGVVPLAGSTRDVVGPVARCVRDAALTLDALAGYTPPPIPRPSRASAGGRRAATPRGCRRTRSRAAASASTGRAGATAAVARDHGALRAGPGRDRRPRRHPGAGPPSPQRLRGDRRPVAGPRPLRRPRHRERGPRPPALPPAARARRRLPLPSPSSPRPRRPRTRSPPGGVLA